MNLVVSDVFPVSRPTFVHRIFLDPAYNDALHTHLDFKSREVLEQRETPDGRVLRIRYTPNREIPRAIQKVVGSVDLGYEETLTFDAQAWEARTVLTAYTAADRIFSRGVTRFEALSPTSCRRTLDVEITVKVPVIGGLIARTMARDVRDSYERTRAFTLQYIRDHGLEGQ